MQPNPAQMPPGDTMNRKRVIIATTVAVFVILCILAVVFFHGIPPWPVLMWFTVSHLFFCVVIARVKPYRGPYGKPMSDPMSDPVTDPHKPGRR
jgi:hypothetical protein